MDAEPVQKAAALPVLMSSNMVGLTSMQQGCGVHCESRAKNFTWWLRDPLPQRIVMGWCCVPSAGATDAGVFNMQVA